MKLPTPNSGAPRKLPPEGLHVAICCDLIDKGEIDTAYGRKHKILYKWQIQEDDDDYIVSKLYTLSGHPKSHLRQDLEKWNGRKISDEEIANIQLEDMIGKTCQIQVTHTINHKGDTWPEVSAIVPAPKGTSMRIHNYEVENADWLDKNSGDVPF